MNIVKKISSCAVIALSILPSLHARDVLLEFKASYFRPTDQCFQAIFNKSGALYGPEIMIQLAEDTGWYGFASAAYLSKDGHSIGLCSPTRIQLVPLALGVQYCADFNCADLYLGLGVQPTHVKTTNCSSSVAATTSQWGVGGIAKFGAYVDLSTHLYLDLFINYSFVNIGCAQPCPPSNGTIVPLKSNVSGMLLGAGLGYRFA